jgi:hypothetical protein
MGLLSSRGSPNIIFLAVANSAPTWRENEKRAVF